MKTKTTATTLLLAAIVSMSVLSGCISVKRETEPSTTTTTTSRSHVVAPTSTTVERTTTY